MSDKDLAPDVEIRTKIDTLCEYANTYQVEMIVTFPDGSKAIQMSKHIVTIIKEEE